MLRRRLLRWSARLVLRLFTRTRVTGREHLQTPGPVLFCANHDSTFDALLFMALLPVDTVLVGPGDFTLRWPGSMLLRWANLIPMKRGAVDRDGLKRMLGVLKDGQRLALFPEGGTWEKPIDEVKSGASYLSQASGAQMVPMAFGGTYLVWGKMRRLQRPRVTIIIGAPLPAVTLSGDRARRQDELQSAAEDIMRRIYELLPAEDRARYDRFARQRYSGALAITPSDITPPPVSFDALAELVAKPNLFSPLHNEAGLPVKPFQKLGQPFPVETVRAAATALWDAFDAGDFATYLEYRFGEEKAHAIQAALAALRYGLEGAETVAFVVTVTEDGAGRASAG
ncbi:MAG: 1-acyl-sn-glycerol-3-phosphate acyltransferase [Chloroflexi bacterium]|nr:1-acyl-sn-glycerol-3-phosphate acyltransferase [Chloroflexota bacterium]